MHIPFWKVQSIGNDFVLLDLDSPSTFSGGGPVNKVNWGGGDGLGSFSTEFPSKKAPSRVRHSPHTPSPADGGGWDQLAIAMCDRQFGIGGDGLLTVQREEDDVRLRMFNPDGTEDFCGNGIRCAAEFVFRQGWVSDQFTIRHLDRTVPVGILKDGAIRTQIGLANYTPQQVPHKNAQEIFDVPFSTLFPESEWKEGSVSALSTGSTHLIVRVTRLPESPVFERVSKKLEHHPLFPDRTSVIWTQEAAPNHLKLRIWERGVGETMGCGTGSTAAAADAMRRVNGSGMIQVENPGGSLMISLDAWDQPITIEGYAFEVFHGVFEVSE